MNKLLIRGLMKNLIRIFIQKNTIHSHSRKSIKIKNTDFDKYQKDGWEKGRVIKTQKIIKTPKTKESEANYLFEEYKKSNCYSITTFIEKIQYPYSKVNLTNLWKKYIPEYKDKAKHGVPLSLSL